jgi:Lrp/AsnC family transcriptional regulator, regulator for asnA, asnC and gidA
MGYKIILKNKSDKRLDETDIKIIDLMVLNKTSKEISSDLQIPLSTVQRRVRELLATGYVTSSIQINYEKFGFKTGLIHVYLKNGNIEEMAKKIHDLTQIIHVEIHIGNSDILGNVVYKEGIELLNLIAAIKKIEGVERIVWSERIYQSHSKENENMVKNILNNQKNR